MTAVLLLTGDDHLAQRVLRLAAAAGAEVEVLADPGLLVPRWREAVVLLVGADRAASLASAAPERREGCWLVSDGPLAGTSAFRDALALGAAGVLELPEADQYLVDLLADLDEQAVPALVVGVIAGAGGAGATTLAAALAQTAARTGPALLVDTDPLGPGADRMVGLDGVPGLHWEDLPSGGRLGARALREGVPRRAGLGVLTWAGARARVPLVPATVRSVVAAARRGHDHVLVDVARHGGPLAAELVGRCDLVLLLAPATVPGVAAAARVAECLGLVPERAALVVRPGSLLDADVAAATGLPVACRLADQRGVRTLVDAGLGPASASRGPLGRATRLLLERAA